MKKKIQHANDENKALFNWLTKTKPGKAIWKRLPSVYYLEKFVTAYAMKHKNKVAGLSLWNEDGEALNWVTWQDLWDTLVEQDHVSMVSDVFKFADVAEELLPPSILAKIDGQYEYKDTSDTLREHLYSMDILLDEVKFTKKEKKIMHQLKADLDQKECSYFRLIVF